MQQKFKDYRTDFYTLSGKASDVTRQLAFAGIAVVWIFKQQQDSMVSLPEELLFPALTFVVTLALDLLQYVIASVIWGCFLTVQERSDPDDDKVIESPTYFNAPAYLFFILKTGCVLLGYFFLISYFLNILTPVD